jgi:hypothetical protein
MLKLTILKIKEQLSYVFPMLIILVGAVLFGTISSIALSDRQPEFRVGLLCLDEGEKAGVFAEYLAETPGIEIEFALNYRDGEELLNSRRVEALVVVEPGFESAVTVGSPTYTAARIVPAPGTMSADVIREAVALSILRVRAFYMLETTLTEIGEISPIEIRQVHNRYAVENPVIGAVYFGPITIPIHAPIPPMHGAQALFLLLSLLHAAVALPGISGVIGKSGKRKNLFAGSIALIVIWSAQLAAYLLVMSAIFASRPSVYEFAALFGLIVFCVGLGGLLSALSLGKTKTVYLFIPFFILNMTIGGALWGRFASIPLMDILFPVAGALRGADGELGIILTLLALGVLMMTAAAAAQMVKSQNVTGDGSASH